jgi:polar amino acid transport system substrate-binding protein
VPNRRLILLILGIFAPALALSLILLYPRGEDSLGAALGDKGLRIGYALEAPYAYINHSLSLTGEDIELAREVAKELGVRSIEWKATRFPDLIDGLLRGDFDLIAAGMFITKARAERVAFSAPSFHVGQGLLVRKGNPLKLHSYESIAAAGGARVAVIAGAVEEGMMGSLGVPKNRIMEYPDASSCAYALSSSLVDCVALSSLALGELERSIPNEGVERALPFVQPNLTPERQGYGAFAFRKADLSLRRAWDEAFARLKASGRLLAILERFGFTRAELPGDATVDWVLEGR